MKRRGIHINLFFVLIVIATLITALVIKKNTNKQMAKLDAETLRAMNYEILNDEDMYVEDCRSIQFGAYFARDIDGDGYADKLLGTCKEIGAEDTLWINVNVSGDGELKNGIVTINGTNFKYKTNIQKSPEIKENRVSDNTKNIAFNDLSSGTSCNLFGQVISNITKKDSYSSVSTVTLTGTYVSNEGEETEFSKSIDVTVDWYGTAAASIYGEYNSYDVSKYAYGEDEDLSGTETISFNFKLYEYRKELIVKSNSLEIEIPELLDYKPTSVTCSGGTYDEETGILTVTRNTTNRSNDYTVSVSYPKEAFSKLYYGYSVSIKINGYIECYNNPNEEFTNPYVTEKTTGTATVGFVQSTSINADYLTSVSITSKKFVSISDIKYAISKQKLLDAYNTQETPENMRYTVGWKELKTSKATLTGTEIIFTDNNDTKNYGDKIDSKVMSDYISNVGIYFDEYNFLDKTDGSVSIYDNDTNELVKTFTYEELKSYTASNPYYYDEGIKHIRAETSVASVVPGTYIYINNIKEIDTKKVLENFTEDEVSAMSIISTTVKSVLKDGESTIIVSDLVNLIGKKSGMNVQLSTTSMSSTEILQNEKITITAISGNDVEYAGWKNGIFLVEIPKNIVKVKINDVSINSQSVQLLDWSLYQENGTNFIKIITSNEEPTGFSIVIDCDLTPNPLMGATSIRVNAYGYNENANIYWNGTQDIYDINGNDNTLENVAINGKNIGVSVPSTFITVETVSNYNENDDITIAPNIAEITKDTRSAQINLTIKNNHANVVDELQILGKIPFIGNTYVNGTSLNSEFTATMKNTGITVPEKLKDAAKVYYSTKEDPTEDLADANNGWTLAENVESFENVRTYLIVLEDYELKIGEAYEFNYGVEIPEGIDCNKVSYSCHKVNYYLRVDDGSKLPLSVQPNKVGIRVVRNYDLEIMKYKKGTILGIQGATYKLYEDVSEDEENNSKSIISDSNGVMSSNKLRANQVYIFEEVKAPDSYELNEGIIKFKIEEQDDDSLKVVILEGSFAGTTQIVKDENGNDVFKSSVEDEPKYKLEITKIDSETNETLSGIIFELDGKQYPTKADGKLTLEGLKVGKEYILTETYANGYYTGEALTFVVVKDGEDFKFESNSPFFKNITVTNNANEDLIKAEVTIINEKIPTYNFQVVKVEENTEDKYLKNARFLLKRADLDNSSYYTTDENGQFSVESLYQYVEGKSITGKYTLKEVEEPYGYMLNSEEITFVVSKNDEDKLEINIENKENLDTVKAVEIDGENVKLIIQDKSLFKVTKVDEETGDPLANADFIIYELDKEAGTIVDYAKDANGNYVGKQNENGDYIITTDKTGTVTAPLRNGVYKMIEVGYPEGYEERAKEEIFEITSSREANTSDDDDIPELIMTDDTTEVLEINYIEDLVELSNTVNSGANNYYNTTVKLMRNLDFKEDSSYRDPTNVSYGDLNGDGVTKGIKEELTDENGCGFTPIGKQVTSDEEVGEGTTIGGYGRFNGFTGIFDGQGYEIRNIYIDKSNNYVGLFGVMIYCRVKNLGITGKIMTAESENGYYSSYMGGICGYVLGSANIENSYNKCDIVGNISGSSYVGGLVGLINSGGYIINSYNTGNITGKYQVAGIVGQMGYYSEASTTVYLINCYNKASITGIDYVSGIIGNMYNKEVYAKECYNTGDIIIGEGAYEIGGIIGNIDLNNSGEHKFLRCYNTGNIVSTEEVYYVGGIVGKVEEYGTINLIDCYNTGNMAGNHVGGIAGKIDMTNINIDNCYNTGHITSTDAHTGGIVGLIEGGPYSSSGYGSIEIKNCYNIGDVDAKGNGSYNGGIAGEITTNYTSILIDNCYNEGNLNYINDDANDYYNYIGGIAGCVFLTNARASGITVSNCYNTSDIKVKCDGYIGGLFGYISGYVYDSSISRIYNCYNTGNIEYSVVKNIYAAGIIGTGYNVAYINKCYNSGNIIGEINTSTDVYIYSGGIIGAGNGSNRVDMCYNTGNIKSKIISSKGAYAYIGGIAGGNSNSYYSVNSSYNTGNIDNYVISTNGYAGTYVGGIISCGNSVYNSYNTGNVSNYSNSSATGGHNYAGGIAGSVSYAKNNYSVGSVYNNVISPDITNTTVYTSDIIGCVYGNPSGCETNYYLEDIEVVGETNGYTVYDDGGVALSKEYMKSERFYNDLSTAAGGGNLWKYINNQYPVLDIAVVSNAQEVTELTVENTKKEFDITTEIVENGSGSRVGGTISGVYNEKYIQSNYKKFIETVTYGKESTQEIIITPDNGYKISKITVNNERIEYKENEEGIVTIPAGYFKSAKDNYNIAVTFTELENILTINKVDEKGNALENAIFKIDQVEDRPEVTDEIKNIVGNSNVYTYVNKENDVSELLSELTDNGDYYFVKQDDGTYIPNNSGVASSIAESYMKIDLTYKTGNYMVVVNAKTSSQSGQDIGIAAITKTTDAINNSTNTGRFITGSGNVDSKDYTSSKLEGGNVYYLHFAYSKNASIDTGDDRITINSVNLYGTIDETYDFNESDGKYVSSNQGKNGTYSMSYIPIDLTQEKGKYTVTVNAEISSQDRYDYGYAMITDNTGKNTSHYNADGKFVYLTGSVDAKDYTTVIEAGMMYYLHIVYYNNSVDTDNGTDTFTINSVNLSLNTDDFYHEENATTDSEGKIVRGLKFGKYEIVETQAPEGYTKDDTVITHVIATGTDNNITVTNKALKDVVIHYYENETGSEFNTEPVIVSDDVTLYGNVGDWYSSEIHTTIGNYNLLTDSNGEYVIPDNASGRYENDQVNVYYYYEKNVDIGYRIEHYYENKETGEYELKYTDARALIEQALVEITEDDYKLETGYEFERQEGSPMAVRDNSEDNVIKIYYGLADFDYTVKYFYDGEEDTTLAETKTAEFGDKITTYTDKVKTGYMLGAVEPLNENGDLELTITSNEDENIINIYYVKQFEITTNVIEHTEVHKDGTIDENIKGGDISGEDSTPYEYVEPGESNNLSIEVSPNTGYQIVKITINNKEFDFTDKLTQDGKVIFQKGYFTDMNENKHIEVEFRKSATVTTKYLDKETNEPIGDEVENKGYESKQFETVQKTISTYEFDSVTDEEGNEVIVNGNMPAEGLVVIYWYNKIESGVIERHIEIKDDGSLETIETKSSTGKVGSGINILRKQLAGYEAVDGSESTEENVFSMKKEENSKTLSFEEGKTFEVLYYYKKKKLTVTVKYMDNLTGEEIKTPVKITGTLDEPYNIVREDIPGYKLDTSRLPNNETGTFTEEEITVEYYYIELRAYDLQVIYKVNNEVMDGAKIKVEKGTEVLKDDYTINGVLQVDKLELTDLLSQTYTIYETEIPEHCKTIVSKDNPGTVELTGTLNEELGKYEFKANYNEIEGFKVEVDEVNRKINVYLETTKSEKYNLAIKKFITEIDDEVIENRIPQVEISADGVISYKLNNEIEKASNNQNVTYTIRMYNESDVIAKGKRIVEYIPDGLVYVPDNDINKKHGWVMYGADAQGQVYKTQNPEKAVIVVTDYLVNKEINAFDKETDTTLSYLDVKVVFKVDERKITTDDRTIDNKVIIMPNDNDDYPDNDESIEKLYVKYFDLDIDKYIEEVKVKNNSGEKTKVVGESQNDQLVKVDVKNSEVDSTTITVTYGLKVKNIGEIPGYATKLIDYIPENFKLIEDGIWTQEGNTAVTTALENKLLNPGESTTVKVTFEWKLSEGIVGARANEAKIATYTNEYNAIDLTDDNNDKEELLVTVKTGSEIVLFIGIVLGFLVILVIGIVFNKKIVK